MTDKPDPEVIFDAVALAEYICDGGVSVPMDAIEKESDD